ncbi:MAG: type II secretion system protein [Planctomycetota bacterium]|jgi:prepilin-type N-terminal cleavage/methylation domain-containing protein
MKRYRAFTLIEILVVVAIISTLAGLVSVMIVHAQRRATRVQCIHNMSELVRLLETSSDNRYPAKSGADFVLDVVGSGLFADEESIKLLFCPGDMQESAHNVGGVQAYADMGPGSHGHLTSYAGRRQKESDCSVRKTGKKCVLLCDDSLDHHDGEGIVVGISGGSAKFRKIDGEVLQLGDSSPDEELRCLSEY